MKILKNILENSINIRTEKNFPKEGIEFIDINPLIIEKDSLNEIINKFYYELKDKKIDYIICPEARGFLIGSAIAYKLNVGLVPVRKKGKLPPTTVEKTFSYEKEYGKDNLELPRLVNDEYKDKNFYIIDDIYATGNTVNAIKEEVENINGNIIGVGVIINIEELNNDKNVFSLIDVNES